MVTLSLMGARGPLPHANVVQLYSNPKKITGFRCFLPTYWLIICIHIYCHFYLFMLLFVQR